MQNNREDGYNRVRSTARWDFETARRKGFWRSILARVLQKDNNLLPFDEVLRSMPQRGQHYVGMRQVLLEQIVGSVGRYNDFDRAFLPRQSHTRGRWMSIDSAYLRDVALPAVELYKVGDAYFVKDGNHRVSVARERGQAYIDAVVIEIDIPIPVDASMDIDTIILKREEANFLESTRLGELLPGVDISLTLPGGYQKLLEHISVHRWFMGIERNYEIAWEDAVRDWYNNVYLPLVQVIRENDVLKEFPDRREADLYLWVIEHLWFLRQEYKTEISLKQAASHFVKEYSRRPLTFIRRLLRDAADFVKRGR